MVERKKIESGKVQEVLARLDEIPKPVLTARQFIVTYFEKLQALQQSGRPLKAIYQFLLANGIDVGTYESFRTVYRQVKRVPKAQVVTENLSAITEREKTASFVKATPAESEKAKTENDVKNVHEVMAHLSEMSAFSEIPISARQFIIMNFEKLDMCVQSGKSLSELHHSLLLKGVDVGSYTSFYTVFTRIKRARRRQEESPKPKTPVLTSSTSGTSQSQFE